MRQTSGDKTSNAQVGGTPLANAASVRRWSAGVVVASVVFVASWLLAASWQGPHYSVMRHSISDMYANGAPGALFLIVVITLCGATVLGFAWRALWPSMRQGGRLAVAGVALLAASIFGLGDLLTPFEREACRLADRGCTASAQVANAGGLLDSVLSIAGLVALIVAGFLLAAAMARLPEWRGLVRPTRWATVVILVLLAANGVSGPVGLAGLFERLLAAAGAAAIAALGTGVWRRARPAIDVVPEVPTQA
jgi:hypothetical protein